MYWQGYGPQSVEEKQKLLRLLRNLNFNGESVSEPYTPTAQSLGTVTAADGFYSPELRGEFGAGLLDLHAMDDTELLSEVIIDGLYDYVLVPCLQHVFSEPFEPSPFFPTRGFDDDYDATSTKQQVRAEGNMRPVDNEKEITTKESNVAKIKVVVCLKNLKDRDDVRKRPLNKKEKSRKEDDIVTVNDNACLTVHEPKLKVL
ncbi:hypothetical protein GW17_00011275 [Ensete ventricosum]|nr:hypothetical protein GW17_00011275 [Ensete ventricosum]